MAVDTAQSEMVIAVGPFDEGTDFGPEYPIYTLDDDAQYLIICENPVSYLSSDHQKILREVPA